MFRPLLVTQDHAISLIMVQLSLAEYTLPELSEKQGKSGLIGHCPSYQTTLAQHSGRPHKAEDSPLVFTSTNEHLSLSLFQQSLRHHLEFNLGTEGLFIGGVAVRREEREGYVASNDRGIPLTLAVTEPRGNSQGFLSSRARGQLRSILERARPSQIRIGVNRCHKGPRGSQQRGDIVERGRWSHSRVRGNRGKREELRTSREQAEGRKEERE